MATFTRVRGLSEAKQEAERLRLEAEKMEERLSKLRVSLLEDQRRQEKERPTKYRGHRWRSAQKAQFESAKNKKKSFRKSDSTVKNNQISESVDMWTAKNIQIWLEEIGMEAYGAAFEFHQVSGQILLQLNLKDLENVGVQKLSDRNRILVARDRLKTRTIGDKNQADTECVTIVDPFLCEADREDVEDERKVARIKPRQTSGKQKHQQHAFVNAADDDHDDGSHEKHLDALLNWRVDDNVQEPGRNESVWTNPSTLQATAEIEIAAAHNKANSRIDDSRLVSSSCNTEQPFLIQATETSDQACSAYFIKQSCWNCYKVVASDSVISDASKGYCSTLCKDAYRKLCTQSKTKS